MTTLPAPVFKKTVEKFLVHLERNLPPATRVALATAPWKTARIAAFWSAPIESAEQWRELLCSRNRGLAGVLENSLLYFQPRVFFKFFPLESFVYEWPYMRGYCPRAAFTRRGLYDLIWSLAAANSPFVPPLEAWFELKREERDLLVLVLGKQGKTAEEYTALFENKQDEPVVDTLTRLVAMRFLQRAFLNDAERYFRESAYIASQIPRPIRKVSYILKDGTRRTIHTTASY